MHGAALSDAVSALAVLRIAAAQCAVFLALLLIASAAHKALQRARVRRAAQALAGVSPRYAASLATAAAIAEVLAGCLLLIPAGRLVGALLAVSIWGAYGAALARAWRSGKTDVDCGCSFGAASGPLGPYQWLRAFGLATLAALVAAAPRVHGGATLSMWTTQLFAATALLGLYAAVDQVMALRPLRSGEVA